MTTTQQSEIISVKEEDMKVPARDVYQILIRVYKPEIPPASGRSLIIFNHGGIFCICGLENEEVNCRLFAKQFGAVYDNVDYHLTPQHPFPTLINGFWDACKWVNDILMLDDLSEF